MTEAYTVATALAQIEKCDFECEGGPLSNNTGWRWLTTHLQKGPKFALGEWVWHDVTAEVAAGVSISQPVKLCIVAIYMIYMGSATDGRAWTYSLSSDPPDAYHHGSGVQFNSVAEAKLRPSVEAKPSPPSTVTP